MFLPQEVIRAKRDGDTLSAEQIQRFIGAIDFSIESAKQVDSQPASLSEGQMAAFAMAVFFNGMNRDECVALTLAMRDSGRVLDWSSYGIDKPIVDKHSTGGVGDNVSLMLAPVLAACGVAVPMISGRGLGHTGGTLDKLDSIPGYNTQPGIERFVDTIREAGCAIIGQTDDLAPADRHLYAVRDVTATVESIPLITASILSKKLAAGLDNLVLDVKTGSGAFMVSMQDARALAVQIVDVANSAGLHTTALLTDMDQPLASAAGNALEVRHALDYLTGRHRPPRVHEVVLALAIQALNAANVTRNSVEAIRLVEEVLSTGVAAERFACMASALGAESDFLDNYNRKLPNAACVRPLLAERQATVVAVDTRAIGLAVVALGGGRRRADDSIDYAVGVDQLAEVGTKIDEHTPLAVIHARNEHEYQICAAMIRDAFKLGGDQNLPETVVHEVVSA